METLDTSASSSAPSADLPPLPAAPRVRRDVLIGWGLALAACILLRLAGSDPWSLAAHPVWLLALVLAGAHGTAPALLTVGLGALLFVHDHGTTAARFSGALGDELWRQLGWFGAIFLVGAVRDTQRGERGEWHEDLREAHARIQTLDYECRTLTAAHARLRRRLELRPARMEALLGASARATREGGAAFLSAVLELVMSQCAATRVSVWAWGQEGPTRIARAGAWPRGVNLRFDEQDLRAAFEEGRRFNVLERPEALAPGAPLFLAPLGATGAHASRVLALEDLPPEQLGPDVAATFFALASWAAARLDEAAHDVAVASRERLADRLHVEADLVRRHGGGVTAVVLEAGDAGARGREGGDWRAVYQAAAADRVVHRVAGSDTVAWVLGDRDAGRMRRDVAALRARITSQATRRGLSVAFREVSLDLDRPTGEHLLAALDASCADAAPGIAASSPVVGPRALGHLAERLELEVDIARREGWGCHLAVVPAARWGASHPEADARAADLAEALRTTDGLFTTPRGDLVLLLTACEAEDARRTAERLLGPGQPDLHWVPVTSAEQALVATYMALQEQDA